MPWSNRGKEGKSAYQVWLDAGNTGTMLHFLAAISGEKGEPGPPGIQGPRGADGADGADSTVPGPQGNPGSTGSKGDTGLTGPKGDKGDTGLTGLTGPQGNPGATGSAGAKGDKGDTGAQGPPGNPGSTGATGATGPAGTNGTNGQGVPTGGTSGQVLAKSSSTNYDTGWVTPSAGASVSDSVLSGASLLLTVAPQSGTYVDARVLPSVAASSTGVTANLLQAHLFYTPKDLTLSGIGFNQAGSVAGTVRLGIYAVLSSGYPGAKLLEVAYDLSIGNGVRVTTLSSYALPAGSYYLATWFSAVTSAYASSSYRAVSGAATATSLPPVVWRVSNSTYGPDTPNVLALPDPFPAGASALTATIPLVVLKIA